MEPSSFKKTVIATLQYDKKYSDVKDTLLPIVSRSTISFKSQGVFTSKHGQRWETIEFRVPVPLINTAYEHQDVFDNLFFYVYEEDDGILHRARSKSIKRFVLIRAIILQ